MTNETNHTDRDTLPYEIPPLRHGFDALEPAISAKNLRSHHQRVHRSYTDSLNRLLSHESAAVDLIVEELLSNPQALPRAVRDIALDLAGAHANHQFFWKVIGPGSTQPDRDLAAAITESFGGFAQFQQQFRHAAIDIGGPGFVFLTLDRPQRPGLEIHGLPANASVLTIAKPGVLCCDVWDHAWIEDHPNLPSWIDAFWSIVDWNACSLRYEALRHGRRPA